METDELTKQELECLRLRYDHAYSNKNIAVILNRSVRTVEGYFRSVSIKLKVDDGRWNLMLAYNKIKPL